MTIEFRNNGMEIWNDGIMVHSHYSNKVVLSSQVEESIRMNIDRKMPLHVREQAIRKGGNKKTDLDTYFDTYVAGLQDTLLTEANKHRTALSYERLNAQLPQLDALLNGLPLTVDQEVIDVDGETTIEQVPNPLREGYEPGHVMLDGLPLQVEEQLYDAEGNPTTTQMIDNPERIDVQSRYDTAVSVITRTEANADVMVIVSARGVSQA